MGLQVQSRCSLEGQMELSDGRIWQQAAKYREQGAWLARRLARLLDPQLSRPAVPNPHASPTQQSFPPFPHVHLVWAGIYNPHPSPPPLPRPPQRNYRTFLLFVYTSSVLCLYVFGVCVAMLFVKHDQLVGEAADAGQSTDGLWGKAIGKVSWGKRKEEGEAGERKRARGEDGVCGGRGRGEGGGEEGARGSQVTGRRARKDKAPGGWVWCDRRCVFTGSAAYPTAGPSLGRYAADACLALASCTLLSLSLPPGPPSHPVHLPYTLSTRALPCRRAVHPGAGADGLHVPVLLVRGRAVRVPRIPGGNQPDHIRELQVWWAAMARGGGSRVGGGGRLGGAGEEWEREGEEAVGGGADGAEVVRLGLVGWQYPA